jgi:hypothetical protein
MNIKKSLYAAFFVTLTVIISITSLAITKKAAQSVLETRNDPETLALLQQIFTGADYYSYDADTEIYTVYGRNYEETGYAFYGVEKGFRNNIYVLVGLEDKETIKNIVVTEQHEDYAYWLILVTDNFLEQFAGLKIENCFLTGYAAGRGQVDRCNRRNHKLMGSNRGCQKCRAWK